VTPANRIDVAVIGSGPYGLAIAAHLRARDVDFRIFGAPMDSWRTQMPKGMFLKSEGFASNLFDPTGRNTLERYCAEAGAPFQPCGKAVSRELFVQYGLAFQRKLVPMVEEVMVTSLEWSSRDFEIRLANGDALRASKVVVATGLAHAAYVPPVFAHLPVELVSHCSQNHDLSRFKARSVTVIGGGQSALETAVLLHEAGCDVRVLVRKPAIRWNKTPIPGPRPLWMRVRRPISALGPGVHPWVYCNAPMLFRYLPWRVREHVARTALGPAGAWWLRDRVSGLPTLAGHSIVGAERQGGTVLLHVQGPDGCSSRLASEHVIAATGYRFALRSLPFLGDLLLARLLCEGQTPILSSNFESSVPGLYFTGLASAHQFGPAMRFLHGAGFTAQRVSGHIAGIKSRVRMAVSALPGIQRSEEI
jgi:thioredoxin reductase